MRTRGFAVAAILLATGCGGGSGGGTAPTAVVTAAPSGGQKQTANMILVIPLPATASSTKRHPQYVSTNSTQVVVTVNTVNGGAPPGWVASPVSTNLIIGGNCTVGAGTETCTVPVPAPPGTVNYTFTAESNTNTPLATLTTSETIAQSTANSFNVTLQGIPYIVNVSGTSLAANAPPSGNSETLTVNVLDPSAGLIVSPGNYNTPVTLTDNDATGVTSLSVNSGTGSNAVVVNSPADVVTLNYNGQAVNAFTITATATGLAAGQGGTIGTSALDVTFTGTVLDDSGHGGLNTDPNWGQDTLFFSQGSGTLPIGAAELGWTNAPYSKSFNVALTGCTGIASITSGPATSFTVTALGSAGICSGRFSEPGTGYPLTNHPNDASGSPTHDGKFWISVTTSSFGVNAKLRHN